MLVRVRTLVSVLILLLAGACASRQPPPPPEPEARSPLVRSALAEWRAWGQVVVVGWPTDRPSDVAATPERFARLTDYWYAVPGGRQVMNRLSLLRAQVRGESQGGGDNGPAAAQGWEDIGLYANPAWSAAFISYVARQAGIPSHELPSANRHASYIDAVLARAASDPQGSAFVPRAPEEWAPRPGDLLCADRSYAPLTHWTQRLSSRGKPRPMHCDVVVATSPGVVEVVGGNVQDLVTRRKVPADAEGRVLPVPPGVPPFMLLLVAQDPEQQVASGE